MRVVALISGGKDSCFNMMNCVAMGHEVVALLNLFPCKQGESDSYMYQTVGSEAIELYSEAMQLPLYRRKIQGSSKEIDLNYCVNKDDEVEDLYHLLKSVQKEISFDAVSCGAILSDYQRVRVENVCSRLDLISLSYLWQQDQEKLLQNMIDSELNAIIIKTAALGLIPKLHLGKTLTEMQPQLLKLKLKYGSHVCGEGGEYETFTLDCPLFKKRIVIDDSAVILHSNDGVVSVAYLHLKSLRLEEKSNQNFDFTKLVPELLLPDVSLSYKEINSSQENFIWVIASSQSYINEEIPLLSTMSTDQYVCISNLFGVHNSTFNQINVENCSKKVFETLAGILNKYHHTFMDVICVFLSLSDMSQFSVINSIYKLYFPFNPPIRVCVNPNMSAADLGHDKKILFKIDCISRKLTGHMKTMHVQGISHWAPANIGPYSQCKLVDDFCFVAGQIGLIPGNMKIIDGGIVKEACLSMNHVKSILSAMDPQLEITSALYCICFLTSENFLGVAKSVWEKEVIEREDLLQQIVYVVVPSLPRQALIEWQLVARKCSVEDLLDQPNVFLSQSGSSDFVDQVETLLDSFSSNSTARLLQTYVFFAKHNLLLRNIEGVEQQLLRRHKDLPSLSWIPVISVHGHVTSKPVQMALVTLSVFP